MILSVALIAPGAEPDRAALAGKAEGDKAVVYAARANQLSGGNRRNTCKFWPRRTRWCGGPNDSTICRDLSHFAARRGGR